MTPNLPPASSEYCWVALNIRRRDRMISRIADFRCFTKLQYYFVYIIYTPKVAVKRPGTTDRIPSKTEKCLACMGNTLFSGLFSDGPRLDQSVIRRHGGVRPADSIPRN